MHACVRGRLRRRRCVALRGGMLLDLVLGVKVVRLRYRYGLSCATSIGRYYFIVSLTTRLQRVNRH